MNEECKMIILKVRKNNNIQNVNDEKIIIINNYK